MNEMTDTIERAFQLAAQSASVEEIRAQLKREGYFYVDAHLSGAKIRADLKQRMGRNG